MKLTFLLIIFIISYTKSYSQRHFTLIDGTHRDTLIYMNDLTGNYVPVLTENLILNHSLIAKVKCGNGESIRSYFLKNGIAILIASAKASPGDKICQEKGKSSKLGFWSLSNTSFRNAVSRKSQMTQISIKHQPSDTPHTEYVSKSTKDTIKSSAISSRKDPINNHLPQDYLQQRKYLYRFTRNNMINFRRISPLDHQVHAEDDPTQIPAKNLNIDYNRLDTIVCISTGIKQKMLLIGVADLLVPHPEKYLYKHALYFAQINKLGIWWNYDIKNKNSHIPDIKNSYPSSKSDPERQSFYWWLKEQWHNHFAKVSESKKNFAIFIGMLIGIFTFIILIYSLFKKNKQAKPIN